MGPVAHAVGGGTIPVAASLGQEAAWADSVIQVWLSQLLREHCPQAVTVCDCFSGQWTEPVLHQAWLNHQFQVPVGPDCTPLLQLADVSVIAAAKQAAERQKSLLSVQHMQLAKREGVQYAARIGKYEIFTVAEAMSMYQETVLQQASDAVLTVARTTQTLALRPDSLGRLATVDDQPWAPSRFPAVRGLQPDWVQSRFSY